MRLKRIVIEALERLGAEVEDAGPADETSVDYPDYARRVAEAVRDGRADRGVSPLSFLAPWPSGKAEDCKSSIPGSNPGGASV